MRPQADAWNSLMTMARNQREQRTIGGDTIQYAPQVIRVSHTSVDADDAGALPRFSVVGLGAVVKPQKLSEFLPTATLTPPRGSGDFDGDTTIVEDSPIGILLDPLDVGDMGWAAVAGIVKVFVDNNPTGIKYCNAMAGVTANMTLSPSDSADFGRFRIVNYGAEDAPDGLYAVLIDLSSQWIGGKTEDVSFTNGLGAVKTMRFIRGHYVGVTA